jgi:hypothetical protein
MAGNANYFANKAAAKAKPAFGQPTRKMATPGTGHMNAQQFHVKMTAPASPIPHGPSASAGGLGGRANSAKLPPLATGKGASNPKTVHAYSPQPKGQHFPPQVAHNAPLPGPSAPARAYQAYASAGQKQKKPNNFGPQFVKIATAVHKFAQKNAGNNARALKAATGAK